MATISWWPSQRALQHRHPASAGLIGDDNYLALKNSQGKYLLNGHFVVSASGAGPGGEGQLAALQRHGTAVESLRPRRPILSP